MTTNERTGAEFGIVWLSDDSLREIGCECRSTVLERILVGTN